MAKQLSCSKTIGRAIRKFGLPAVQSAVDMAVELTAPAEAPKRVVKAVRPRKPMIDWAPVTNTPKADTS